MQHELTSANLPPRATRDSAPTALRAYPGIYRFGPIQHKKKNEAEQSSTPFRRIRSRRGARVASQRSPILRAGIRKHKTDETQMQEKGIDKRLAIGYRELAEGVEAIGKFNNEWDIYAGFLLVFV